MMKEYNLIKKGVINIKGIYALGTDIYIKVGGIRGRLVQEYVFRKVLNIDRKMSAFREDSEVYKINKNSGINKVKVSDDTYIVVKNALKFNKISNKFDITIRPLTLLWNKNLKENKIPNDMQIEYAKSLVDSNDVILENKTIFLKRKGQMIDLGAIAKGYATDVSRNILEAFHIKNALLDFGGNIYTIGKNKGNYWNIGLQNPFSKTTEFIAVIKSTDESIVTSGINERCTIINEKRYHHIIDKDTGYSVNNDIMSVTIISKSSMDADALATIVLLEGLDEGIKIIKEQRFRI